MPLTFRTSPAGYQEASYTNLIPTPITGLTATSTVTAQIVLTWTGGQGNNPVYSFSVYNNTGSVGVASSAYTVSAQTNTGATITFTSNSANSYTVTVTSSVIGGSTSASATVTTANPLYPYAFTNIVNQTYTPSIVTIGGSNTILNSTYLYSSAVAVNSLQTKMLLGSAYGLWYSTSSDGGATWAAFTSISLTNTSVAGSGNNVGGTVALSSTGQIGMYWGYLNGNRTSQLISIDWSGTNPVGTWITPADCFGNSAISMTPNGNIAVIGGFNNTGPISYSIWNSTTKCYSAPVRFTYNSANVISSHVAICISADATIMLDGSNPIRYCTLSWSGNTPTVTSAWISTSIVADNWSKAFIGGNATTQPSYVLFGNATSSLYLYRWTGSGITLVTNSLTTWGAGSTNGMGNPAGTNGNVVYAFYSTDGTNTSITRTTLTVS
jgi:hypothetical protein